MKILVSPTKTMVFDKTPVKQARGLFAAQIIQQQITDAAAIKKIILADYAYSEDLSSDTEWFFVR